MAKIVEGLWDCPYCGHTGIGGLTKHCPNCSHPQDEGTKFYMGSGPKKVLDEEKAKNYGKGADWTCAYCGSLNRYDATACANCGADREENTGDYFENEKKTEEKEQRRQQEIRDAGNLPAPAPRKSPIRLILGVLAAVFILFTIFNLMPKNKSSVVNEKHWNRTVAFEEYRTVQEQDWEVPSGGTVLNQSNEIHHYDEVLDHYDIEQRSEEYLDHYDTDIEYKNNGDGTFSEVEVSVPVYETRYYDVEVPVYVNVPRYATLYTYEIDRWMPDHIELTDDAGGEPRWPDFSNTDTKRETDRLEYYWLWIGKDSKASEYSVQVTEDLWNRFKVGDGLDVTVQNGSITKINDKNDGIIATTRPR